jgi:hypothetical protein
MSRGQYVPRPIPRFEVLTIITIIFVIFEEFGVILMDYSCEEDHACKHLRHPTGKRFIAVIVLFPVLNIFEWNKENTKNDRQPFHTTLTTRLLTNTVEKVK